MRRARLPSRAGICRGYGDRMERGTDHVYAARSTDAVSALLAETEWG
jgi:hypothetical protein